MVDDEVDPNEVRKLAMIGATIPEIPRRQRRLYQQLHFAASPAWDRRFELAVPFP
jgi:hypothetical protein